VLEVAGAKVPIGKEADIDLPASRELAVRLRVPAGARGTGLVRMTPACRAARWPGDAKTLVLAVQR
jgi:hypothetical protein